MQPWTGPCWAMLLRAQRWMTIHQVEQVVSWMANFGLNPQPTTLMTTRGGRCAWLSQSGWPMWKSLTSIAIKVYNSCFVSREPLIIRKITWSAVYSVRSWYCYKPINWKQSIYDFTVISIYMLPILTLSDIGGQMVTYGMGYYTLRISWGKLCLEKTCDAYMWLSKVAQYFSNHDKLWLYCEMDA